MPWNSTVMIKMLIFLFILLVINLLSPRVSSLFLSRLGGALKIDLPWSTFSLAISVSQLLFSELTLLASEINTVVLEDAILGDEKLYPRPVLLESDFWKLSISLSFALEVLSSWALTWNSSASSFLVLSAKKLFLNRNTPMVWLVSLNFMESSS